MKRIGILVVVALVWAGSTAADVSRLEHRTLKNRLEAAGGKAAQGRQANKASGTPTRTGEIALIDASGLEYFINTDITFTTTSSASGAASEASYTQAVMATTLNGGTVSSSLNDSFDGYGSICISLDGATGPCTSGAPGLGAGTVTMYNQNGAGTTECGGRQVVLNTQNIGGLSVQRKVYVPSDDAFIRWMNIVTNSTAAPLTVSLITANNLGSDSNTAVVTSSDGDATVEATDTWATTFQNFSGTTSSDPRLGHVFQGPGAPVQVQNVSMNTANNNPFWNYSFSVAPGETRIIVTFATGQPSRAAAAAKAAEIVTLPDTALACATTQELDAWANFVVGEPPVPAVTVPALDSAGLAALVVALACAAAFLVRRRQRA